MAERATVMVVDDEAGMREFLSICLERAGYAVVTASGGQEAIAYLDAVAAGERVLDLLVTDLTMPKVDGMEVLRRTARLSDAPPVVMMTAYAATDTAIEAMKLGAVDYLTKPFKVEEFEVVVERALAQRELRAENVRLRDELRGLHRLDRMIGKSESMHKVFELVRRVAPTKTNVLIRGESGTGKELVARALHNLSGRADGPFAAVNCGAIPEHLMESELFGHTRGSFTGATTDRVGMFEAAQGGTLFLDEVAELDTNMQVKLLRALQERRVRPVGGTREIDVDCRVVAATNRDVEVAVEAGELRQDLYFRLNVIQIVLPPLRHRLEDIPLLVERFFNRYNAEMGRELEGVDPSAMDRLLTYDYPGNVRELENLIERAVALEAGAKLTAAHLPELAGPSSRMRRSAPAEFPAEGVDLDAAVQDLERGLIEAALRQSGGVRKRAAALLRISFRSLRYRLEKLGIEVASVTRESEN